MAEIIYPGEDKAWELLATLKPDDVCKAASVSYDTTAGAYVIKSFGMEFAVSTRDKSITRDAPESDVLLKEPGFFRLSVLWYLVHAKNIDCTGRLVKPLNMKGGDIFTRGSHVLPLDQLAAKYGKDKERFIQKGISLGGELEQLGDAAIRLYPLPRVPVVLSLWLEDEEFAARADLFFDSTCDLQIPTDIAWSIAMMCLLVML
ncbi:MAG: DUF3786 domain-containing protein [Nitrospirota bacterium]